MELLPGLYWLVAGYANVYVCVDDDGLTLVDCGTPRQAGKILDFIGVLGYEPSNLQRILITHADFDHAGSAEALQRQTGATVIAAPATADYLRHGRASKHIGRPFGLLGQLVNRYAPVSSLAMAPAVAGTVLPVLGGLQVLATPGHTPDHHAFFSATRGVLFAGDALSTRSARLSVPASFITADDKAARASALRLLQLQPILFACGHGDPLVAEGSGEPARLQQALSI
jgi:glyoxylase-like metal-dependent hydrolase (beta-lactamase superfamily II)